jgi:hypothetical protein
VKIDVQRKKLHIVTAILLVFASNIPPIHAAAPTIEQSVVDPLDKYRNMTTPLSVPELREMLSLVGFEGRGLRMAMAVAVKESNGNPLSRNTTASTGDDSYGLFQINLYGYLEGRVEAYGLSSKQDLLNPVTNAEVAFKMSSKGRNWSPWKSDPGERDYKLIQRIISNGYSY